jgi:ketosteroid isomerase-like protein
MNAATPATQPASKQRMSAAWAAFGSRDGDRIAPLFTPDAEWLAPPGNATAMAIDGNAHLVGRDRIVRFLTREFGTVFVADVAFDITGMFADGDVVITEARMTGTLAHGGHYENDYCFIAELKDGLIHRVREYMDTQRGAAWFKASPS